MGREGRHMRSAKNAAESLEGGIFGRIFTSYGKIDRMWRGGAIPAMFSRMRVIRALSKARIAVAHSIEDSAILRAVGKLASSMPWLTMRSYGTFLFSFGFYISIVFAIKAIATSLTAEYDALVSGIVLMLGSVPLLLSRKTFAGAVASSRFMSYLAFDILGYRREAADTGHAPRSRSDVMFLFGMIAGLLTFFFTPGLIIGAFLSLLLLYIVFAKPETGIIILFSMFPFFSDRLLASLTALILASYLIKLICGRRTLELDFADTFMLLFFLLMAAAEAFNYGAGTSHHGGVMSLLYMTPYFLTVNLIKNQAWRNRLMRAMMFGGSSMAVVSICSVFVGEVSEAAAGIGSEFVHTLLSWGADIASCAGISVFYLAMMMPVMMGYVLQRGIGGKRFNMIFFSAVVIAAAVMTMSRGLWFGAAVGIAVMLFIIDLRLSLIPLAAVVLIPLSAAVLPANVRGYITELFDISGSLTQRRVGIRQISGGIFFDNFFGGIGRGDGVFYTIYDAYSSVGASADNSQSLFLQIGIELGVVGLFVFLMAMLLLLIKLFTGAKFGKNRTQQLCSGSLAAGLIAALAAGISNQIWVDGRMLFLFFMFAGAASAYSAGTVPTDEGMTDRTGAAGDGTSSSVDIRFGN